jgi:dnd system-associated protein 4
MDRRIAAPSSIDVKNALERLTTPLESTGFALFESKQKALMFAASLGRFRGSREPLKQRDTGSAIRFEIFETAMDDAYVFALAIATTGELKVLDPSREEEVVTAFEEYAHGGLIEMNRQCFESGLDPLDALIYLTQEVQVPGMESIPGVDADVLRDIMKG